MNEPSPAPTNARDLGGLFWVIFYLTGSMILVALTVAVAAVGAALALMATQGGEAMAVLQDLISASEDNNLPPWFMALVTSVQFPTMVLAAWISRAAVRFVWYRSQGLDDDMPWSEVFALRRPTLVAVGFAALMGLTTGWLPGWFAHWMRETFPVFESGALDLINNSLTQGALQYRLIIAFWVAIGAAVVEEIVFRGFIWEGLQRMRLPPVAVWILSSVIFAGYHLDPVQSTALIFTALVLGWVRWKSNSIIPGIILHGVNNSLGVAGAWMGAADSDLPLSVAVAGAACSVGLCYAMTRLPEDKVAAP